MHVRLATPDLTFNGTGKVLTDFSGSGSVDRLEALAIQSDGKIVATGDSIANGRSSFAVARYTTTGTLDGSFNATGKVLTGFASGNATAQAVAIQIGRAHRRGRVVRRWEPQRSRLRARPIQRRPDVG